MNEWNIWAAFLSGLGGTLAYHWGRRVGRDQAHKMDRNESAAIWDDGHEEGFWNGRLSHGDPQALTGIEHAKAANPFRKK